MIGRPPALGADQDARGGPSVGMADDAADRRVAEQPGFELHRAAPGSIQRRFGTGVRAGRDQEGDSLIDLGRQPVEGGDATRVGAGPHESAPLTLA